MSAVRTGNVIAVAGSFVDACYLLDSDKGYAVKLHCAPKYTFLVDAETGDMAQKIAVHIARCEGLSVPTDAATFTKRGTT
jgi:hypothetical protein